MVRTTKIEMKLTLEAIKLSVLYLVAMICIDVGNFIPGVMIVVYMNVSLWQIDKEIQEVRNEK